MNVMKKKNPCLKNYKMIGTKKKAGKEVPNCVPSNESTIIPFQTWLEEKDKKPYKDYNKEKNHPEGGLSRKEAKKQGIKAGIDTKKEASKKGGFSKLSDKTQKRRKSFCARMCKAGTSKSRNDPNSKQRAALKVWGCRC